jgi:hypothetical protein
MHLTIHVDANGRERHTCGDATARSMTELARTLVSLRIPDQPWTAGWEGRPPSLSGRSLFRLAAVQEQDDDRRTGWRWYVPHPKAPLDADLAGVLEAAKQARAHHRERPPAA